MDPVTLYLLRDQTSFAVRRVSGREVLGCAVEFELELIAASPVDPKSLAGAPCILALQPGADRAIAATIVAIAAAATAQREPARRYRATVRSTFALFELVHRSRVFQHQRVPEIVSAVLARLYPGSALDAAFTEDHPERAYLVQYDETDAHFVRRLCEEEGLFFWFECADETERIVLRDDSTALSPSFDAPLALADVQAGRPQGLFAYDLREKVRVRPGRVTLRDYDQEHPSVKLEGTAERGGDALRAIEVYEAPGGFSDTSAGKTRARRRLESLAADARVFRFVSNDVRLAPGKVVELAARLEYAGSEPDDKLLVTAVEHDWRHEGARGYEVAVTAIPLAVPFRLERRTKRPRAAGVQPARVTCAPGEEITPDAQGRVYVHFHWDREGPIDDKSSLPVRVLQANTPGSMALPRRDWEVIVGFESCDPDRPYVLGRAFNTKFVPPESLPKNKTVTSMRTYSSPGGGGVNGIQFNDAAGAQLMSFAAAFGRSTSVANNAFVQTGNNETLVVSGSQSRSVGANESLSLSQQYRVGAASQSASVGATQSLSIKGSSGVAVSGAETVLVGGALLEQVGNPAAGAANLAKAAALQGVGSLGRAGAIIAQGAGLAEAGIRGYQSGGLRGAAAGLANGGMGMVAGMVPGGEAVMASIQSSSSPSPWLPESLQPGGAATGGGTAGASAGSGAEAGGAGHRVTMVNGAMTELIGGAYGVATPGKIGWNTTGACTHLVGGAQLAKTARYVVEVLGGATEVLGSLKITTAGGLSRKVIGGLNTTIAGALTSSASAEHSITAGGALALTVGGSLTLDGATVVFECGGTKVTATSGGVTVTASTITITGASKQSGLTAHK